MADGKIIIETEVNSDEVDKWLNNLPKDTKEKLNQTQKQIESLSQKYSELAQKYLELTIPTKGTPIFKSDAEEAKKLKKELQDVARELERITGDKIVSIKGITDLKEETTKYSKNTVSNFKEMANTIKKFGLSLIGLRSIYSIVSRASSAYLSQDTELAEKLRSVWVGLGSFLAPVLEMISNSLLKALGYLNVFIKALTGIDFLARANAKALKSQATAQKELNNQTYDFDVIRKQQDNTTSGGGVSGGGSGLFEIPELDERLVSKLENLAKWLKKNWYWIKEVGKVLLAVFGAVAIGKILKSIGTLLGMNGLGGLSSILSAIATIGVITIGVSLLYTAMTGRSLTEDLKNIKLGIDEVRKATEENTKQDNKQTEGIKRLTERMKELNETNKLTDDLIRNTTSLYKQNVTSIEQQIKATGTSRKEKEALSKQLDAIIEGYDYLYQNQKLNEDETYDYIDAIGKQIKIMKDLGFDTSELEQKYKDLTGKDWNLKLNAETQQVESKIYNLVKWINDLFRNPFKVNLKATGDFEGLPYEPKLREYEYALGGIVTQPTRALIGEAGYPEAVVPMTQDYLSTLAGEIARYGNSGNGVVNVYLDGRLIQRQVSSKEAQRNFVANR